MKELLYALRSLLHLRKQNIIKIISLTLGFGVGLILFAYVAFDRSFDRFYKDADRLYLINCNTTEGDNTFVADLVHAPVPEAFRRDLPEVESATVVGRMGSLSFFYDDTKYTPVTIYSDSLFFQTMGLEVIKGDEKELGTPDKLFVSEEYAARIFKDEDPVGKVLLQGKKHPYVVAGIFKDIPENTDLPFDAVASFANMKTQYQRSCDWNGDVQYWGYVRLKPGIDTKQAMQKIPSVISKYVPEEKMQEEGIKRSYFFTHIYDYFSNTETVDLVLSLLAFMILFVMAMNYILISISSLATRAKMVGVHKCSGASGGDIFRMFLFETVGLFAISLLCMVMLLLAFRSQIEGLTMVSLKALFAWGNLWLPALAVVVTCTIVIVIPGRMFAKIPVTQVFQASTPGKWGWKRVLLFVQFAGIAFIASMLVVVLVQYHHLMNRELGYTPDNVVFAHLKGVDTKEKYALLASEFKRIPYVESVSSSMHDIANGYVIRPVYDKDNNRLFNAYSTSYDPEYPATLKLSLLAGHTVEKEGDLLITEMFAKRMGWSLQEAVGQTLSGEGKTWGTIVGVMKDFDTMLQVYTRSKAQTVIFGADFIPNGVFTLRLSSLTTGRLAELNKKLQSLHPNEDMEFIVLTDRIYGASSYVRSFRNGVLLASIVVFIITLMGLFGFIDDEVSRRSKEIAIRKINGATIPGILRLFSKGMTYMALPAIILGVIGSVVAGATWLQQFPDKASLHISSYIICIIALYAVVMICVLYKLWSIAIANPADSIRTE